MGKKIEHTFINGVEYKWCYKCKQWKPLSEFSKDKTKKDGLQRMCKGCQNQYYTANREHMLERQKQYNADNAERLKQWRDDNAEHIKQYKKQYYATIEGYARRIRNNNLGEDRKQGRIGADEDPLPPLEQYIELLQQSDYYDKKHYPFNEMGLDRIDNSKPHTIDNVVPCSTKNNRRRGRKSFEEFCELIQKENELELVL